MRARKWIAPVALGAVLLVLFLAWLVWTGTHTYT
jgi:hypothetical protein